jgi:REP element-mobilizing transposase RayT
MKVRRCKKYIQPSLDSSIFKEPPKCFGGEYLKNSHPRTARPVTTKAAMHVVLRSRIANNEWALNSTNNRKKEIEDRIRKQTKLFNIKLYQMAVNQNHIHLLIKLYTKDSFSKFIKAITGITASIALGVKKGKSLGIKYWESRPFSRIVAWAKDYFNTREYVIRNDLESYGIIPYAPRAGNKKKYKYKYEKTPIPLFIG